IRRADLLDVGLPGTRVRIQVLIGVTEVEVAPDAVRDVPSRQRLVLVARQPQAHLLAGQPGGEELGRLLLVRKQARGFQPAVVLPQFRVEAGDRKSTRLNSSHLGISYAVFCLKKKKKKKITNIEH